MAGPFRLLSRPAGDLMSYASSTTPGAPVRGHVLLCHDLRGTAPAPTTPPSFDPVPCSPA